MNIFELFYGIFMVGCAPKIPEDLYNMIKKAVSIRKHLEKNRKDKDSKWEYEAKATNLLNISSQVRNSANTISVFNATTFIQPRFITARVVYSL